VAPSNARTRTGQNRPTHQDMFCSVLQSAPGHTLERNAFLKQFNDRWTPWDPARFFSKLDELIADDRCPIAAVGGNGGRVRYTGSESGGGATGSGLHNAAAAVLRDHGLPGSRQGTRTVVVTANRRPASGRAWTTPDLVMRHESARHPEPVLHTFEVEPEGGFDIRSVYQAHAQGRGADFSWVVFDRGGRNDDWKPSDARIADTARLLGIGLVSFSKPSVESTWIQVVPAQRRAVTSAPGPSKSERKALESLLEQAG